MTVTGITTWPGRGDTTARDHADTHGLRAEDEPGPPWAKVRPSSAAQQPTYDETGPLTGSNTQEILEDVYAATQILEPVNTNASEPV